MSRLQAAYALQHLAEPLAVDKVGPRGIGQSPRQHAAGQGVVRHLGCVFGGFRQEGTEGVDREERAGCFVEEPDGQRAIVQWRRDSEKGAVPYREPVTGANGMHPVERHRHVPIRSALKAWVTRLA